MCGGKWVGRGMGLGGEGVARRREGWGGRGDEGSGGARRGEHSDRHTTGRPSC